MRGRYICKSENITRDIVLSNILFIIIYSIFAIPIHAECYPFDDSGWSSCRGEGWMLDNSEGQSNNNSIKSGMIIGIGESSICRDVVGPAAINFWWKRNCNSGRLLFLVDGKIKCECGSEDWINKSYLIRENNSHTIEWRFWKTDVSVKNCAGWIDDVCIITFMEESEPQISNITEPQISNITEPQISNITEPQISNITEPQISNITEPQISNITGQDQQYYNKTTYADKRYYNDDLYIYQTITEAIRHVENGGIVKVAAGYYPEELSIFKPLHLISIDKENTYLGDNNGGNIISLNSQDVLIDGFIIRGGESAIYIISGTNYTLSNNIISRCGMGINILDGSNCKILNNTIYDCSIGASIMGSKYEIYRNNIFRIRYGIKFSLSDSNITDNYISMSDVGMAIKDSTNTMIISCNLTDISTGGIHLDNSSNCTLNKNTIEMESDNNFGIYLKNSDNNKLCRNIIKNSNDGIIFSPICKENIVETNNIFKNIQNCDIFFIDINDYYNTSCPGLCVDMSQGVSIDKLCKICRVED